MDKVVTAMIERLIDREGGFVDHQNDPGGATKYGITENTARAHGYRGEMSKLTRLEAKRIYHERFWVAPGLDRLAQLAPAVAEELLDTGVNMGPGEAVKMLQRALNALAGAKLKGDGALGPVTLAAVEKFLRTRKGKGIELLVKAIDVIQGERYIRLVELKPQLRDFIFGWLDKRIGKLL